MFHIIQCTSSSLYILYIISVSKCSQVCHTVCPECSQVCHMPSRYLVCPECSQVCHTVLTLYKYISYNITVSYTHLRAHETDSYLVCRLLLEKKKKKTKK